MDFQRVGRVRSRGHRDLIHPRQRKGIAQLSAIRDGDGTGAVGLGNSHGGLAVCDADRHDEWVGKQGGHHDCHRRVGRHDTRVRV